MNQTDIIKLKKLLAEYRQLLEKESPTDESGTLDLDPIGSVDRLLEYMSFILPRPGESARLRGGQPFVSWIGAFVSCIGAFVSRIGAFVSAIEAGYNPEFIGAPR